MYSPNETVLLTPDADGDIQIATVEGADEKSRTYVVRLHNVSLSQACDDGIREIPEDQVLMSLTERVHDKRTMRLAELLRCYGLTVEIVGPRVLRFTSDWDSPVVVLPALLESSRQVVTIGNLGQTITLKATKNLSVLAMRIHREWCGARASTMN